VIYKAHELSHKALTLARQSSDIYQKLKFKLLRVRVFRKVGEFNRATNWLVSLEKEIVAELEKREEGSKEYNKLYKLMIRLLKDRLSVLCSKKMYTDATETFESSFTF